MITFWFVIAHRISDFFSSPFHPCTEIRMVDNLVDSMQGHRTQCLRIFQRPQHPMGINTVSPPSSASSTQQDLYLVSLTTLPCHSLKL